MAARYMRLLGFGTSGDGDLALSHLHLYSGAVRCDDAAILTCSIPPLVGAVSDLINGASTTRVVWGRAAYAAPGFALMWDFGASVDCTKLVLGAGDTKASFAETLEWQVSGDGINWISTMVFDRIGWAGTGAGTIFENGFETETFATNPAGKYLNTSGSASVTWDSVNAALTVSASAGANFTQIRSLPPLRFGAATWVEADIKLVADSFGRRHFGLFVGDSTAMGYRAAALDGGFSISRWKMGVESSLGIVSVGPSLPLVEGSTYSFRFDRDAGGGLRLTVNDVERVRTAPDTDPVSSLANIAPGIFCYGSILSVLEMRVLEFQARPASPRAIRTNRAAVSRIDGPPLPAASTLKSQLRMVRDVEFGGAGRIWGTTKTELSPANRVPAKGRVSILRERDKLLAREVWSDPVTGAWEVGGLDARQSFIALAQDPAGNYMPAAADRTRPEEAP